MAFFINVDQLRTLVSSKWRPEFPRTGSLIHQLFANEIAFTEFEYGEKVVIPLATDGVINKTWDPNTGSKSNYATRKKIEATLNKVNDIQERIGRLESKAVGPKFIESKIIRLRQQMAEIYDKYDAEQLVAGGTAIATAKPITKNTILEEMAKMRIAVVNSENEWTSGFLLATADVVTEATYAKLVTSSPDGVLGMVNGVVGVVNGCITIEVPKSRLPENVNMIWVNTLAYATFTGIDLPMDVGMYTDEKYMGQVYIAEREFFTGKVAVAKMVHYHKSTPDKDAVQGQGGH